MKLIKKSNKGFTIIEVMIVLAISGVIMAVVLLAVPALQRNSRNNGRISDVSRIAAAVSEWMTDNNGSIPSSQANLNAIKSNAGTLSQYSLTASSPSASGDTFKLATGNQSALASTDNNLVRLVTGAKCDTTTGATTSSNASTRQIAIQYMTETSSSGFTAACRDI